MQPSNFSRPIPIPIWILTFVLGSRRWGHALCPSAQNEAESLQDETWGEETSSQTWLDWYIWWISLSKLESDQILFVPSVGRFCNQLENQIDQFGSAETSMLKNMYDNYKYPPNTDHFNFTSCTLHWFQFRKDVIIHLDVGTVPVWNFRGYFKSKLWYPEPCHA